MDSFYPSSLKAIKIKENCTANDISRMLNRDKAQVTRLLNSLIELDLITKVPNPEDKRSQRLLTTPSAEHIFEKIDNIDANIMKKITQGFSDGECLELQRMLKKINDNLR